MKAFLNKAGSLAAGRSHACTWRLIVTSYDGDRHCKTQGPLCPALTLACTGAGSPLLFLPADEGCSNGMGTGIPSCAHRSCLLQAGG